MVEKKHLLRALCSNDMFSEKHTQYWKNNLWSFLLLKRQASNTATITTSNIPRLPSNCIPSGFPSAVSGTGATQLERRVLTPLLPRPRLSPGEPSTLLLGEQAGTPGVTAAGPTRESGSAAPGRSLRLDSVVRPGGQLS